jgi:hypothetical protein
MNASATAARILWWAAEPAGPPPAGPLWDVQQLAAPPAEVCDAAGQLARQTGARLGAGAPPFGARVAIGPGTAFLAAAVGGRQQPVAAAVLARAVPPATADRDPGAWYDLVARHGLAAAVVAAFDGTVTGAARPAALAASGSGAAPAEGSAGHVAADPLPELLLEASPLTAVLYRPPLRRLRTDSTRQAELTAAALLRRPRGQQVLAAGLSGWLPLPDVLSWRTTLLSRLRHAHQDLLLDVYFAARTRHAAEWDNRIKWAARQFLSPHQLPDALALATLRFWAPLAALDRASKTPLSGLRPLLSGHEAALGLVRTFRLDQAGAA